MIFRTKERLFSRAVVVGLAAVLVVLAALQYRWSKQVSEAATARMKASLQGSMMDFRQDLTRELTAICLAMQQDGASSGDAQYVRQFRHWQQTATHPGLVTGIYLWQFSADEEPRLLRLDLGTERFQMVTPPSQFALLRNRLQNTSQQMAPVPLRPAPQPFGEEEGRREGGPFGSGGNVGHPGPAAPWGIDENIPALVHPIPLAAKNDPKTVRWVLVELDANVLDHHVIPELAERHFRGSSGLVYDVGVFEDRNGRTKIIYSSDPQLASSKNDVADAVLNLWGPPGPPPPGAAGPLNTDVFRPTPRPRRDESANFSRDRRDVGFAGPIRLESIHYGPGDHDWQLVVRHRKGSVEAAVAEIRRRNLLVSFGILLVLGGTMALIVITSQRAHRLAALQMDFVAGVSHELRTPLAVISSAAANIADGVVSDSDQLVEYGNIIQTQAKQLNHLVEQVLQFAATKNGQTYTIGSVDVTDAIEEALATTQSVIDSGGFSLDLHVEPNLPPVKSNLPALSQILQNLITNAVKYGGEHHWIGIRAFMPVPASEIAISVEDRGLGMDAAELQHVFEPFYRSPSVVESNIHGTGLGLPLAKSIAERIGGRLTVVSKVGNGSTFTIHLPVAAGPEAEIEGSAANADVHPNIINH